MTYEEMVRRINTAGAWFTGVFIGEILIRYHEWHDEEGGKVKFIKSFYKEYGQGLGYTEDSVKTKCYAVMSLVENHKVLDAIEFVINCNDKKVTQDAVDNATVLLDKICRDAIELP